MYEDLATESSLCNLGLIYKPLCWRSNVDIKYSDEIESNKYSILEVYKRIKKNGDKILSQRMEYGYPIPFKIPPFTSLVMNNINDKDDFIPEVIKLRNEFSNIRKKFNGIDLTFRDDSKSFNEFEEKFADFEILAQSIVNPSSYNGKFAFLREFGSFLIQSALKMGIDYQSLYELITCTEVSEIKRIIKTQDARYFIDVVKTWENLNSDSEIIKRIFNHEINLKDKETFQFLSNFEKNEENKFSLLLKN